MNKFMLIFSILLTAFFGVYTILLLITQTFVGEQFWILLALGWFIYYSIKKGKDLKAEKTESKKKKK